MNRMFVRVAMVAATALSLAIFAQADDRQPRDGHSGITPDAQRQPVDRKAQSGATAADEARIYTAQLRRCEGQSGEQREACVEAARRRLGQF